MIKPNDLARYTDGKGNTFIVRVLNTFEDEGVKYATVEPAEFKSIEREIPLELLEGID